MISKIRGSWWLSLYLCGAGLILALLYLNAYKALGQMPMTTSGAPLSTGPAIQFSASSYTVTEGDTATITVTLSAASTQDVYVTYSTSDGTGQAFVDYTPTSTILDFPPGTTSQSFTVSTLTDPNNTSYVTVNLSLTSPSPGSLGNPSTATLYIVNSSACPSQ